MPRGKPKYIRCEGDGGDLFLINEVSRLVNLSQKRIREYEKEGFIKPLREKNTNNRLYSNFDVSQINQINSLIHDRGFTLACLRNLMVLAPCWNIFDCNKKEACPAFQLPPDCRIAARVRATGPGPPTLSYKVFPCINSRSV